MSIYDVIAEAKESEGGNYLKEGHHELTVSKLIFKKSRKGDDLFIAEFTNGVSWVCNMRHDASPGNVKSFLKALVGADDITGADVEEAVSEANPAEGLQIVGDAFNVVTRAGFDFVKVKWTHVAAGGEA